MNWFNIYEERLKQLEKQEKIDSELSKLKCKEEILFYFFSQREENRKLTKQFSNASFYQLPGIAIEQLERTGKELDWMESILDSDVCLKLHNRRVHTNQVSDRTK